MAKETEKTAGAPTAGPQDAAAAAAATDLTEKTYNTALQVSDLAGKLMAIVRQADAIIQKGMGSGITFNGADFSGTALKFCTGDDIATASQAFEDIKQWLSDTFRDDVLDKVSST